MGGKATRRLAIALGVALVSGCGGAVVSGAVRTPSSRYATTPTAAGAIDPRAVPLGDGYVSTRPRVGYVDSCIAHFGGIGGAQVVGPWIDVHTKTWNYLTKIAVNGAIRWPTASYRVSLRAGRRLIVFNDLPTDHATGVFPISPTDPAYQYDRNPNRITPKTLTWSLPGSPAAAATASCTGGGPIGVLNDGVVLYNALDGEGRDAGAHEVLDLCAAHPDPSETYHHHDVPACILNKVRRGSTKLVGYALDGYGIYVQRDANGVMPNNAQLDACHGRASRVLWNGKLQRIYHYVATLEYPYTIGCFHGVAAPR